MNFSDSQICEKAGTIGVGSGFWHRHYVLLSPCRIVGIGDDG
jgi:hypothetical protein